MKIEANIQIHLHGEPSGRVTQLLEELLTRTKAVQAQETHIMAALDDLATEVEATATAEQSAIVLLNGLSAALAAAGTDPAKLGALRDSLKSNTDALAAAVVANTPVTPPTM